MWNKKSLGCSKENSVEGALRAFMRTSAHCTESWILCTKHTGHCTGRWINRPLQSALALHAIANYKLHSAANNWGWYIDQWTHAGHWAQLYNSKLSTGHKALHFQLQSVKRKLHQVRLWRWRWESLALESYWATPLSPGSEASSPLLASVESSRQLSWRRI